MNGSTQTLPIDPRRQRKSLPARVEPTLADTAYAAGFFDGEGCVRLQRNNNGGYSLRVVVSQKDPKPLAWMRERWGGSFDKYPSNVAWMYYLYSWSTHNFLVSVSPFLLVKKQQVLLAASAFPDKMTEEVAAHLSRLKKECALCKNPYKACMRKQHVAQAATLLANLLTSGELSHPMLCLGQQYICSNVLAIGVQTSAPQRD